MRKFFPIILLLILIASTITVSAHDWYSAACCSGMDCHPIASCTELVETAKGIDWNGYHFNPDQIHPSQDSQCHVCISEYKDIPNANPVPHCVYIQQGS